MGAGAVQGHLGAGDRRLDIGRDHAQQAMQKRQERGHPSRMQEIIKALATRQSIDPKVATIEGRNAVNPVLLRWVPFTGQFQLLTSLTSGGRNRVRSQYRPHGEFCPPGSCGVYHGNTSTGSVPG
jgi:hypothetical protein